MLASQDPSPSGPSPIAKLDRRHINSNPRKEAIVSFPFVSPRIDLHGIGETGRSRADQVVVFEMF